MPLAWLFQVSPVKARSVPFSRSTLYCMGVSICFHSESGTALHSASDLTVLLMFPFTPPPSFAPPRSDAATRQASPAPREARPMRTSRRVCIRQFYHAVVSTYDRRVTRTARQKYPWWVVTFATLGFLSVRAILIP